MATILRTVNGVQFKTLMLNNQLKAGAIQRYCEIFLASDFIFGTST